MAQPLRPSDADTRLAALRAARARRERDLSLGGLFDAARATLDRSRSRLGGAGDAWASCCPPGLAARASLVSLARGVLTVRVPDAPTRFELDRALRAGLENDVIARSRAPIRKVRVVTGGA